MNGSKRVESLWGGEAVISFEDTPEQHKRVFEALVKWCLEKNVSSGLDVVQGDRCQESLPELISDIVDEILCFEILDQGEDF